MGIFNVFGGRRSEGNVRIKERYFALSGALSFVYAACAEMNKFGRKRCSALPC